MVVSSTAIRSSMLPITKKANSDSTAVNCKSMFLSLNTRDNDSVENLQIILILSPPHDLTHVDIQTYANFFIIQQGLLKTDLNIVGHSKLKARRQVYKYIIFL